MPKTRIAGAIATKTGITLYLENGETHELSNTSWKTKEIVDQITPILAVHGVAEIDLDQYDVSKVIEQRSGGLLSFVRKKFRGFFGAKKAETTPNMVFAPDSGRVREKVQEDTLVAIVGGKEIPGMEKLEAQMEYAVETNNQVGLQRFLERLAVVIDKRGHETQELLSFMQKGDLPIADDGSIIAYKRLKWNADKTAWVDCHSGKVTQRLGSHVSMKAELVDPNRRELCSTGLHIARRDYLSGFHGDVMVMVKVAPEDVIAVPYSESSKMRVAGYHIVAEVPKECFDLLVRNKSMTSCEAGAQLLGNVIAGTHAPICEYVRIGGEKGSNVTTELVEGVDVSNVVYTARFAKSVDTLETRKDLDEPINPRDLRQQADEARLKQAAASGDFSAAVSTEEVNPHYPDLTTVPGAISLGQEAALEVLLEEEDDERPNQEVVVIAEMTEEEREELADAMDEALANYDEAPESAQEPEPVAPAAPTPDKGENGLTEAQERALALFDEGKMSQRAIERETGVPVRTLKRLIAKRSA